MLKAQLGEKHPRGRGENAFAVSEALQDLETPPRARGKPHQVTSVFQFMGNTPAGAGKTVEQFTLCARQNAAANGAARVIVAESGALFF